MTWQTRLGGTTYCSGYWRLDANSKRSFAHYLIHLNATLNLIRGGQFVLFHDDPDFFDHVRVMAERKSIAVRGHRIALDELPAFWAGEALLAGCRRMEGSRYLTDPTYRKDKGVAHFRREYAVSGEESYRKLMAIWMSKIPLIADVAIHAKHFDSDRYAWMDISVSRFRLLREGWDFTRAGIPPEKISHYGTDSWYQGKMLKLNASYLCGDPVAWRRLDGYFGQALNAHLADDYAHDEETVLGHVQTEHPSLFNTIGNMHRGMKRKIFRFADNRLRALQIRAMSFGRPRAGGTA